MPSNLKIGEAARNAACNAIVGLVDSGPSAGALRIFGDGAGIPATPESPVIGQTLCTVTLAAPAFGSAAGGEATLSPVDMVQIAVGGLAQYFRISSSAGLVVMQGTVGESSDSPDLVVSDKQLPLHGYFQLDALALAIQE